MIRKESNSVRQKKMSKNLSVPSTPPPTKKFRFQQGQVSSTEHLYLSERFVDVHFLFVSDDGTMLESVPGHRNLLAADSDVFEKMFYGNLKETGDVTIVDATAAAFKEFMQFFYLSEVKLSAEHIAGVMYLGHKYNVKKCIDGCVKLLRDDLTNENVCNILPLVDFDEHNELMRICERRIMLNTAKVFASAGFLDCNKVALGYILRMNLLPCSEVDVFEACMTWVQAKSKQTTVSKAAVEKYLGELYREIRFVSMTMQEFCALKVKYDAVLADDFEAIVRLISRIDIHSEQFNTFPRQAQWDTEAIITCDRKHYNTMARRFALEIEEKTTFSSNEPVVFGNNARKFITWPTFSLHFLFGLFTSITGSFTCDKIFVGKSTSRDLRSTLSVDVVITEANTSNGINAKILWSSKANLSSKHSIVLLTQPILIRPGLFYTIRIGKFPDDHCHYSKELKNATTLDSNINMYFYNDKTVKRMLVGLISVLNFNKI